MYAYHLAPVDFGWELLPTLEEMAEKTARNDAAYAHHDENMAADGGRTQELFESFKRAKEVAKEVLWEGDYRERPRVFLLPEEGGYEFRFGFVWKQDNNGSTFLVTPIRIQAYEEDAMYP